MARINHVAAAAVLGVALAGAAEAATLTATVWTISGTWVAAEGGPADGLGTDHLEWGMPVRRTGGRSSYVFAPAATPAIRIAPGDKIPVGRVRHRNAEIDGGSITQATLALDIRLTLSDGTGFTHAASVDILHDETANEGPVCGGFGPPPCGDVLVPVVDTTPTERRGADGAFYAFRLTGVEDPLTGAPVAQARTPEWSETTLYLFAALAANAPPEGVAPDTPRSPKPLPLDPPIVPEPPVIPVAPVPLGAPGPFLLAALALLALRSRICNAALRMRQSWQTPGERHADLPQPGPRGARGAVGAA